MGEKGLPKRKHPRLSSFDYSASGRYFVTICADQKEPIFSDIVYDPLCKERQVSPYTDGCRLYV